MIKQRDVTYRKTTASAAIVAGHKPNRCILVYMCVHVTDAKIDIERKQNKVQNTQNQH